MLHIVGLLSHSKRATIDKVSTFSSARCLMSHRQWSPKTSNFIKGDHPLYQISHQCSILLMVLLKGGILEAASVLRSSLAALWKAVKIQNKSLNITRWYWEPFECNTNLENRRPSWGGRLHLKLNRSGQKCQIRCASPLILQKGWVIKALFLKIGAILQSSDL